MIISINVNGTWQEFKPSEMTVSVMDISAPDAGRDQTGYMWTQKLKNSNGDVILKHKIQLAWWCPDPAVVASVLNAIKPERFYVSFHDPFNSNPTGGNISCLMYVGDREMPVQMWGANRKFYSRLAFDLIEV